MQHYQALSLLSYANGAEPLRRALQRREAAHFVTEKGSFYVRPIPRPENEDEAERRYLIEVDCDSEKIQLCCRQAELDLLVSRREPSLELDEVSGLARALVVEFIFEDVIRLFETVLGARQSITQCNFLKPQSYEPNAFFEVSIEGVNLTVSGHFGNRHLEKLWNWSLSLPREKLRSAHVEIAIRAGTASLTAAQLKSLRIGDGVVLAVGAEETWFVVVGEKYLAPVSPRDGGFELTGPLLVEPRGPMRHMMDTERHEDAADDVSGVGEIGDIPIKIVFNAGRLTVPMAELENIDVGHIFEMDRPEESSVEIVAQGVVIGHGKILRVNGLTAVQVTSIGSR